MSELKATTVYDAYWKANSVGDGTGIQVYLKSEADKVISDLEESHKKEVEQLLIEIVELKADYKEACDRLQTANLIKDEQLAATRHQKFKRCLDKANYWMAVSYNCIDGKHRQKAEKHHYKYLKLAERFK